MKSVCVYCGSSDHMNFAYIEAAREMGRVIAEHGLELWYGAGSTGLMGALADSALEVGGTVIGVIPALFNTPVLAHNRLTRLEIVESMHQRKERLAQMADAFIALPGGFGTFEELFEILTWSQIGLHRKPVGILNALHYFDPLLVMVEHAREEGFIYNEHRDLFVVAETPVALMDALEIHQHPSGLEKWLTRTT
jgi:uncharacterized protein (TIGR00730 family)